MFKRLKWFASLLQWPLWPLVKYKVVPLQPAESLELADGAAVVLYHTAGFSHRFSNITSGLSSTQPARSN